MMRQALRGVVVLMAVAAFVDPPLTREAPAPLAVDVRAADGSLISPAAHADGSLAWLTAQRPSMVVNGPRPARATLVLGEPSVGLTSPRSGPVLVLDDAAGAPVRIVDVTAPARVSAGWTAVVNVSLRAHGLEAQTTRVVLLRNGLAIDSADHKWTSADERAALALAYVPAAAGADLLTVAVADPNGVPDAVARRQVAVIAESRRLSVLVFDARPSWTTTFLRRALEQDAAFDVTTQVRASKGIDVGTRGAPATLTANGLERYDAVVLGAPEDVTAGECAALDTFVRRRGGTLVLVPDRSARWRCASLGQLDTEEVLLPSPIGVTVTGAPGGGLQASEFALPRRLEPGARVLAVAGQGAAARPAIVALPRGAGEVVHAGTLDAWRFRDAANDAFGTAWRYLAATAALRAPRPMEVHVSGVGAPGTDLEAIVRLRGTLLDDSAGRVAVPAAKAQVIDAKGMTTPVRLWPLEEAGVFRATLAGLEAGRYDLRVSSGTTTADAPVFVSAEQRAPAAGDRAALLAAATGGAVVAMSDTAAITSRLSAIDPGTESRTMHPARSIWWMLTFVLLACGEWTWRRRQGAR